MQPIGTHNYYVYIVTNNLQARLQQHYTNAQPFTHKSFAGKYNAYNLLYYERFEYIQHAIAREKEIKGWLRSKKEALINTTNPEWRFLNSDIGL